MQKKYSFVAVADMTRMHQDLLDSGKRYRDMSGNNNELRTISLLFVEKIYKYSVEFSGQRTFNFQEYIRIV